MTDSKEMDAGLSQVLIQSVCVCLIFTMCVCVSTFVGTTTMREGGRERESYRRTEREINR